MTDRVPVMFLKVNPEIISDETLCGIVVHFLIVSPRGLIHQRELRRALMVGCLDIRIDEGCVDRASAPGVNLAAVISLFQSYVDKARTA